ncbi:MAG: tRNA glutamyl-Q(34) synthetase GluQRS, partial [Cocleimonas sp.]
GRFAPSPTGPLHFGSLIAATASYLSARSHINNRWLLRIEDLDTQRSQQQHTQSIIHTLEQFGFKWDDKIHYQSNRSHAYQKALDLLSDVTYPCSCTRSFLRSSIHSDDKFGYIYPGFCREGLNKPDSSTINMRLKTDATKTCFTDMFQGEYCQNLCNDVGDFILKRSDGSFAYQLAVVVDDASQGINQIIRGADLFDNTPRQMYLQNLLGYITPHYGHFPVAVTSNGKKLSKQNLAPEISTQNKRALIIQSIIFLGQTRPNLSDFSNLDDLWAFAVQNWDQTKIPKTLTQLIKT